MPSEDYLKYLNLFGLVVIYDSEKHAKVCLPYFSAGSHKEIEFVLDYLKDSDVMENIITKSVERYSRIIDTALKNGNLDNAEMWKTSYSNLCFLKSSYDKGGEILISGIPFRKK